MSGENSNKTVSFKEMMESAELYQEHFVKPLVTEMKMEIIRQIDPLITEVKANTAAIAAIAPRVGMLEKYWRNALLGWGFVTTMVGAAGPMLWKGIKAAIFKQ